MIGIRRRLFNVCSATWLVRTGRVLWAALFLSGAVLAGCRSTAPGTANAPQAGSAWDRARLEEHLKVLNYAGARERATGTEAYHNAAEYVAAQFRQIRLQPALFNDYRIPFETPLHAIRSARVAVVSGADTLALVPGADMLPDARSDSGEVAVSTLLRLDKGAALGNPVPDAVILEGAASDSLLRRLRDAGVRVAVMIGALRPNQAKAPVSGLLAVQVTPQGFTRLEQWMYARASGRLNVYVNAATNPAGTGEIVAGYLGGADPVLAKELILVCADLDAMGQVGGVETRDMEQFGIGIAAMLELARRNEPTENPGGAPERTVLFAALFGGRLDEAGLRAYLRRPLWPLRETRALLYIGLSAEREAVVRKLLEPYGVELYAVHPDDARAREGVQLILEEEARRQTAESTPGFDLSQTIDRIYPEAVRAADEAGAVLLDLAHPAPAADGAAIR